ncbi:MAG: ABC transporter permease [Sedimentisphaerales bacterium]|nr:ABC transporter permease [Sedimentisphaerales bacterium]
MSILLNDIKYAFRRLRRSPGFTLIVVLVFGLGIGAATSIFSVVHKILWEPLPMPFAERLVGVWESNPEKGQDRMWVSPPNFLDWREQADIFDEIAAFTVNSFILTGGERPQRCKGLAVTDGYFKLAGVTPELGRAFCAEDMIEGTNPVVLIGYRLWQSRFGGDNDIIGQTVKLNDESFTLVGVMPDDFILNEGTQLWVPLVFGSEQQLPGMRGARHLHVLARLREEVTMEQAQVKMNMVAAQIAKKDPVNRGWGVRIIGLHDQMVSSVRPSLLVLLGGAGLLLLTACANITNLLITRITDRQQELAIQQALGATRSCLLRHLLIENLLLALSGWILGILIAYRSVDLVTKMSPWDIPRLAQAGMNIRTFSFGLVLSVLVVLACGALSAGGVLSLNLARHLKNQGRQISGTFRRERLRCLLVVTETAFSVILLIVTGLMARSFWSLKSVNPGFVPENIHTMTVSLPVTRYPEPHQQSAFFERLLSSVENIPGVADAALVTNPPFSGNVMTFGYNAYNSSSLVGEQNFAQYHAVSPDYFKTIGIKLLHGRTFSARDNADGPQVVIINETLARKLWGTTNAAGQRIGLANDNMREREVVGVVSSVKHKGLDADIVPEVYVPFGQNPWPFMTLVARSDTGGQSLAAAMRERLWMLDSDLLPNSTVLLEHLISKSLAPMRFRAFLVGLFAVAAVLLAAVGLYAMISYTISGRTREFGIRLALGAKSYQVLRMVLFQGLKLSVAGVVLGAICAVVITRIMRGLLYEISPTDPVVFMSVALLLTGIALLACVIPARRASKIDPMEALRSE